MSRQPTPDIMGSLMGNAATIDREQESHKTIKPEENKESSINKASPSQVKPESNKEISVASNKKIMNTSNKAIRQEMKEKATFNLTASALESLESTWMRLRRSIKGERITKTSIVEAALELCISEFEEKEDDSALFKRLSTRDEPTPS